MSHINHRRTNKKLGKLYKNFRAKFSRRDVEHQYRMECKNAVRKGNDPPEYKEFPNVKEMILWY